MKVNGKSSKKKTTKFQLFSEEMKNWEVKEGNAEELFMTIFRSNTL